jgi:hypothetical protein
MKQELHMRATSQLMPFDVAPDPNGEYSAWVIPVAGYDGSFVHASATHDEFNVNEWHPAKKGHPKKPAAKH